MSREAHSPKTGEVRGGASLDPLFDALTALRVAVKERDYFMPSEVGPLVEIAGAARDVVMIEDIYRGLDDETRAFAIDGFGIEHKRAMNTLRASLRSVEGAQTQDSAAPETREETEA